MTPQRILYKIKNYINDIVDDGRVDRTELIDDGAIYYMNANDGTMFDFECNNRTCEFMVFYKESEMGYIKAYLTSDGEVDGYLYEHSKPYAYKAQLPRESICTEEEAENFALWLEKNYDNKGKWDSIV